jgi:hypothetical protein
MDDSHEPELERDAIVEWPGLYPRYEIETGIQRTDGSLAISGLHALEFWEEALFD